MNLIMISHHTPPKSNMTTEKQPFEDVIKHLLKTRDFPASRVIVFGDFCSYLESPVKSNRDLYFFFFFWDANTPSANCKLVVWVGALDFWEPRY